MKVSEDEYKLPFFIENGFIRRPCVVCGAFFWSQNQDQDNCGDAPCQEYTFIGEPPTQRSYNMNEMREAFLSFFERNGHKRIRPYPVVARWRPDLYVTIASIADFQPFVTNGTIPPPGNPLVISQPCLRFVDIGNVGLTAGRHLTMFEMGGAHAFNYPDKKIYWKDMTVRYHHNFLTEDLGVKSDLISYKEGFWSGGGNAGPDVETCVNGLEVSTLVFMQYKVVGNDLVEMPIKIVDTGYGIERLTWLSQGTSSGFHAIYGDILNKIFKMAELHNVNQKILVESAKHSALMNIETASDRMILRQKVAKCLGINAVDLEKIIVPIENAYVIADHTKSITFLLAEGVIPSNVKAGYLTRLLIRRVHRAMKLLGIENKLQDLIEMQIEFWSPEYPIISEMREEIFNAISIEDNKYQNTLERGTRLIQRIAKDLKKKKRSKISRDTLAELYDSHGISPEIVKEVAETEGVNVLIPDNFYEMIAQRHILAPDIEEATIVKELENKVSGLPKTEALYYTDAYMKVFNAKILKVIENKYIVLDKTAFYPEGGGQPADYGTLYDGRNKVKVIDTQKIGNIIVHLIKGERLFEGAEVLGKINWDRRLSLMRHHAATHLITGSSRMVLGEHVWQAGAQKGVEKSRLDISHWAKISLEEKNRIEKIANEAVIQNVPIEVKWIARDNAEKTYGYRLYQGGVVPGKNIRVVKIGIWDVEACGGLYPKTTGEIGLIKIRNTERIQDGVERIIFSAGISAINFVQEKDADFKKVSKILNVSVENIVKAAENIVSEWKDYRRTINSLQEDLADYKADKLIKEAKNVFGIKLIIYSDIDAEPDFLIKIGNIILKKEEKAVLVAYSLEETVIIVIMAGSDAIKIGVHAGDIASKISKLLGGGGGGRPSFGQGGGPNVEKISEALDIIKEILGKQVSGG